MCLIQQCDGRILLVTDVSLTRISYVSRHVLATLITFRTVSEAALVAYDTNASPMISACLDHSDQWRLVAKISGGAAPEKF
jgi:hypothetical protein